MAKFEFKEHGIDAALLLLADDIRQSDRYDQNDWRTNIAGHCVELFWEESRWECFDPDDGEIYWDENNDMCSIKGTAMQLLELSEEDADELFAIREMEPRNIVAASVLEHFSHFDEIAWPEELYPKTARKVGA